MLARLFECGHTVVTDSTNRKETIMTDKQYVLRAAKMIKVEVIAPTRGNPGIVGTDWNAKGKNVIDAQTWSEARTQLNAYQQARANA